MIVVIFGLMVICFIVGFFSIFFMALIGMLVDWWWMWAIPLAIYFIYKFTLFCIAPKEEKHDKGDDDNWQQFMK